MLDIKILFLRPKSKFPIFSWVIRLVQKTEYSHIGILLEEETILDATIAGVEFTDFRKYRKKYEIVKKMPIKNSLVYSNQVYEWAWPYKDAEYSILQNIGLGLRYLKLIKSNPFGSNDRKIVCSELAALFMNKFSGLTIEDSDNYDLVRIYEIVEELKC